MALRPKYLLIDKIRKNITLSGRRWIPHGSSKEGGGKEAGSEEARKEGGSKEEVIFAGNTTPFIVSHLGSIFSFLDGLISPYP